MLIAMNPESLPSCAEVYGTIGNALVTLDRLEPQARDRVALIDRRPRKVYQVPLVHALVLLASFCILWSAYDVDRTEVVVKDMCRGHVVQ